jgi:hypothetical protein
MRRCLEPGKHGRERGGRRAGSGWMAHGAAEATLRPLMREARPTCSPFAPASPTLS